jgi:hypothetical protein
MMIMIYLSGSTPHGPAKLELEAPPPYLEAAGFRVQACRE